LVGQYNPVPKQLKERVKEPNLSGCGGGRETEGGIPKTKNVVMVGLEHTGVTRRLSELLHKATSPKITRGSEVQGIKYSRGRMDWFFEEGPSVGGVGGGEDSVGSHGVAPSQQALPQKEDNLKKAPKE